MYYLNDNGNYVLYSWFKIVFFYLVNVKNYLFIILSLVYHYLKHIFYPTIPDFIFILLCTYLCVMIYVFTIVKWSLLTSSTDEAIAQANGFPPNVLKWTPFANDLAISAKYANHMISVPKTTIKCFRLGVYFCPWLNSAIRSSHNCRPRIKWKHSGLTWPNILSPSSISRCSLFILWAERWITERVCFVTLTLRNIIIIICWKKNL